MIAAAWSLRLEMNGACGYYYFKKLPHFRLAIFADEDGENWMWKLRNRVSRHACRGRKSFLPRLEKKGSAFPILQGERLLSRRIKKALDIDRQRSHA